MSDLKQKYLIGDKVKITLEGNITEVYIGYDSQNHTDIIRYKIQTDNKDILTMGITDEDITPVELTGRT